MKGFKIALAVLLVLMFASIFASNANAEDGSITITIDRKVMPQSLLHPGRFMTGDETITVYDYVIRDYRGAPIEGFIIQTASGQTKVPIDTVKEIHTKGWIHRRTGDIKYVENVVSAEIYYTDGTREEVVMNADFGTIEGTTDLGDFFLDNPHSVKVLVFNRADKKPEPPKEVKVEAPAPPPAVAAPRDSDGDGVPDSSDKCPGTPPGVAVGENGCPFDSDKDGVPDYKDKCPDTPAGASVNAVGCWIIKGIMFDYDDWGIRPEYFGLLDQHVEVLKKNPTMKVEVQGHTDSIGSQEYNLPLSQKRAESVKEYFVFKGISPDRITTRGFGRLSPVASNMTEEGRAQNRRIEIKVLSW
jgi:outer membrane protein OmpA-like peptidoglycan-associated protein